MSKYFIALILFTLIFSSCSTKKDILYIQDFDKNESIPINYLEYKLKVDDILKISITTEIPEAALVFDSNAINPNISNTKDALLFSGFQISPDGFIYFQNLGEIKAIGLTLNELRESLYNKIVESQLLTNPSIDIKILNFILLFLTLLLVFYIQNKKYHKCSSVMQDFFQPSLFC